MSDFVSHNRKAWDREVERGNWWTLPSSDEEIENARNGRLSLRLGPSRTIPESWMERIGHKVLCLASGGGQQGPLLAVGGHEVTVFDISQRQLDQDRMMVQKHNLKMETVQGSMEDLSVFSDATFDTVFNPVSINFVPDCQIVFNEVYRVLKEKGVFMFSIANPVMYIFSVPKLEKGKMKIKYTLPYSAECSLSEREREKIRATDGTFEFSHTLTTILGGLCEAGFSLRDFYGEESGFEPIDSYIQDCYLTFLAVKDGQSRPLS